MHIPRLVIGTVGLAMVAAVAPTSAARFPGEWSNAFTGQTARLRFVGRLDPQGGTVSGRVRCRRCPVRGRLQLTCGPLLGGARTCSGVAANGCAVEGYAYLGVFEGQYDCAGNPVGVLAFGRR